MKTVFLFARKKLLNLCFRSNELTSCGLILAGASILTAYSVLHKVVTSTTPVKRAILLTDANKKVTDEINSLSRENPIFQELSTQHDLRSLVVHASDQAVPLGVGAAAGSQMKRIKKKMAEKSPEDFKAWLKNEAHAIRLKSRSYPVKNLKDVLGVVQKIHPDFDADLALRNILESADAKVHRTSRFHLIDNLPTILDDLRGLFPDLNTDAVLADTAKKPWSLDPEKNFEEFLAAVERTHPQFDDQKLLKIGFALKRGTELRSHDRVDVFRMIPYKEKVLMTTQLMEEYLIKNLPPEVHAKLKDNKEFDKFITRLPHKERHWWSATWRWLLNLLVTKKANDYRGENLLVQMSRPTTGVINFMFFGPIAEPLKLTVDHVSSRFMHKMTGKPYRPGALTHLATTYLIGGAIWTWKFTQPFILGPLADRRREEAFMEGFEKEILGDDPATIAKRKELTNRVIYDQRFHRYFLDKGMVGEAKEGLRLKEAPKYLDVLKNFYEQTKQNKLNSTEELLAHPAFYKEKEYLEKGFPLEHEQTQFLRMMKFNVSGNAYRYKKAVSGDTMKLSDEQLKRIVEAKKNYLLRSEAIFQIKNLKESEVLTWEGAVSRYLDTLPVELQQDFMEFFGATNSSITGNAVTRVLNMGVDDGVKDEQGNLIFVMDNNRIAMMLQALANADMEWTVNEIVGRQMNRKKQTPSGSLVYEAAGPTVTKEQYIGRMPSDMLFIIKSIDEDEAKAEAYMSAFDRISKDVTGAVEGVSDEALKE